MSFDFTLLELQGYQPSAPWMYYLWVHVTHFQYKPRSTWNFDVSMKPCATEILMTCTGEAPAALPAGQKRCSGPSYTARFLLTGTPSSFKVRCGGWSPSWLVPLRATEESRSKLILPSGLGYSVGAQSLAGFSWLASRPETNRAADVKRGFSLPR